MNGIKILDDISAIQNTLSTRGFDLSFVTIENEKYPQFIQTYSIPILVEEIVDKDII